MPDPDRTPVTDNVGQPLAEATPASAPTVEVVVHSSPTRASASWTAVVIGVVILILLVIFVAQNTEQSSVTFLWLHGRAPTAVVLLIAAIAGAVIVIAVGVARILQLRKEAKGVNAVSADTASSSAPRPATRPDRS